MWSLKVKIQRKNFREGKTIIEVIQPKSFIIQKKKKTEVNDGHIISLFLHSARPGIALRSSALSSNFFVLHCTGFNPLDKSHEWHQGFHWEKRGKEKETVEKKKEERRC